MKTALAAAPASALRVRLRIADDVRRRELERLFTAGGHEIASGEGPADLLVSEADAAQETLHPALHEETLHAQLTPRELEVLRAIARGLTNKMIARALDISPHTVKFHVESLLRKLGVRTRTEAVGRALERLDRDSFEV